MTDTLQFFDTAADGLDHEISLFSRQTSHVAIWTCRQEALVCPAAYARKPGFSDAADASSRRGWPVTLRRTGGGVVPLGPDVMNICLTFSRTNRFSIQDGYEALTRVLRNGLGAAGPLLETGATPGSFCDGDWNLSIHGRKLVGTAQRRRPLGHGNVRILAHALILIQGDTRPSALAVDALHQDLGLDRINTTAHTTLAESMGVPALDSIDVAKQLTVAASRELAPPSSLIG
jgi:lipoate-protein ligase A